MKDKRNYRNFFILKKIPNFAKKQGDETKRLWKHKKDAV